MNAPDEANPETAPSEETRKADQSDATLEHEPDRMPTPEEEAAAPSDVDPDVAENYEAAAERGANAKGEGRITPD